ncbi:MAG: RNA-binding ATPase activator esf2 [Trizodia sp. TS-e1964]|nr:MAG: RNA-binding ATPase activator esf2 [Trizodia sp. TS-e1964]
MNARTRNQWLEAEDDDAADNGDQGYDSEAAEGRKGARTIGSLRGSKRQKLDDSDDSGNDDKDDADHSADAFHASDNESRKDSQQAPAPADEESKKKRPKHHLKDSKKILSKSSLEASQSQASKSGVLYLSCVPPYMKPQKVQSLLSPFGALGRIFLTPEDASTHTRRVRSGGNKKRKYTDGWIEFLDKKAAKNAAATLNAQTIGGKKGSYYHDDVWNLKYLRGFKWHHLTEQIANENAERAARLRAEISRTGRENKLFVRSVEHAKAVEGIQEKRRAKRLRDGETGEDTREPDGNAEGEGRKVVQGRDYKQSFRQNKVHVKGAEPAAGPDQLKRVLSQIF